MPKKSIVFSLVIIIASVASAAPQKVLDEFKDRCVGVTDGDTITVINPDKKMIKVRLHGIDTPEKKQAFGKKAKQFTSRRVMGKTVTVKIIGTDKYRRSIGTVILEDGTNLNHLLVQKGLAWWYRDYAKDDKDLEKFESEAKKAKKGLWAGENPVAPWEWRKKSKKKNSSGDVTYTIIESHVVWNIKRSLDIRLSKKVSKETLREIALKLKSSDRQNYKRTFICYFLPGMEPGAGAWATTHFNPDLEVSILGIEQQKAEPTVYITNSGKKYHRNGCRHLKKSRIPKFLIEVEETYQPCKSCKPPK